MFSSHLPLRHTGLVTTGSGACRKTLEKFPLGSVFPQPVNQHFFPTINVCKFIETLSAIPEDIQTKFNVHMALLPKADSNTGVFLRNLRNFEEHLFYVANLVAASVMRCTSYGHVTVLLDPMGNAVMQCNLNEN